jgi:hypothetical protein
MILCNHICDQLKADMSHVNRRLGIYKQGYSWCTTCRKFFGKGNKHIDNRCLCCNNKLRVYSNYTETLRNKYYRNKIIK